MMSEPDVAAICRTLNEVKRELEAARIELNETKEDSHLAKRVGLIVASLLVVFLAITVFLWNDSRDRSLTNSKRIDEVSRDITTSSNEIQLIRGQAPERNKRLDSIESHLVGLKNDVQHDIGELRTDVRGLQVDIKTLIKANVIEHPRYRDRPSPPFP